MTHDEIVEKVKQLQIILLHRISEEGHDNPNIYSDTYRELRDALTALPDVQRTLPHFVSENFDLRMFWRFIRRKYKTPTERLKYIERAFARTLAMLEADEA
ncbi:MAG: hypothetical protein H7X77_01780 [Anaerolineae bacterium]|nr:hypothetical protein [Anaerolineae bacterium]